MRKIRALLLSICFVVSLLAFPVSAATDEGTYGDNIKWKFDADTGILTISGTGTATGLSVGSQEGYMKYYLSIRHLVLEEGFTAVGEWAFGNLRCLESIHLPDSVKTINKSAFSNNIRVKQLYLGKYVETIAVDAFGAMEKLENLVLPPSVKHIGQGAFSCSGIKMVSIPEGITEIAESTFVDSPNLTTLVIPASVVEIKYAAFRRCENITDIYYSGTEEQWQAINIDYTEDAKGESNAALFAARMHYGHTHSWDAGVVIVAPTCTKEGEKTVTCTVCKTVKSESVAPISHQWDNGVITKTADCANEGEKTYTCTACKITKTETVAKTDQHTWDNGTENADTTITYRCTACSAVKTEGVPATEATTGQVDESIPETEGTTTPTESEANAESIATKPVGGTETTAPVDTEQETHARFPWTALCIGGAVLLAGGGTTAWLWLRKNKMVK